MAESATNRVARVPELLSRIFSFSSSKANGQNLLVCKAWSNEVLDIQWRVVIDALPLFKLLAPLEVSDEAGLLCFARPIEPSDWERFDRYAWRVRSLCLWFNDRIGMQIYQEVAVSRRRLAILPNLRTLRAPFNPTIAQLFSHPTVTSLSLQMIESFDLPTDVHPAVFPRIRHNMPALKALSIDIESTPQQTRELQDEVDLTLQHLTSLISLRLPPAWLTERVTKTISELPYLTTLSTANPSIPAPETPIFSDALGPTSFTSLKSLSIWIPYPRANSCLSQAYRPASLEVLELRSFTLVKRDDFKQLIDVVARSCPYLRDLSLCTQGSSRLRSALPTLPMRFEDLKPILSLKKLENLALTHAFPFTLQMSDVSVLLASLKSLTKLCLNPDPLSRSPPSLHISCLSTIASICPSLETLDLYMDASATKMLEHDPMVYFPCLYLLNVGGSRVEERDTLNVAFYLSHIMPDGLIVSASQYYEQHPEVNSTLSHWRKVTNLMDMFQRAMKHGEQRAMSRVNICNPGL